MRNDYEMIEHHMDAIRDELKTVSLRIEAEILDLKTRLEHLEDVLNPAALKFKSHILNKEHI